MCAETIFLRYGPGPNLVLKIHIPFCVSSNLIGQIGSEHTSGRPSIQKVLKAPVPVLSSLRAEQRGVLVSSPGAWTTDVQGLPNSSYGMLEVRLMQEEPGRHPGGIPQGLSRRVTTVRFNIQALPGLAQTQVVWFWPELWKKTAPGLV